ncbi:BrnT family toxin [Methylobacterium sp. J-076]|uniref:BrnT family toxin n=1 Tax=Methylobacterium sp. J-076 TaxID=2836655 RepID=UPI001FB910F6|nr:BrnT family toxin [Methylobacterium sp. J-076]MCJ2014216.1 BrnT family toxin [Methylobacterium sp. J-076]
MGEGDHTSWDDRKSETNLAQRGLDFAGLDAVFDGRFLLTREDKRFDYGETRYNALVELNGLVLNVTFTPRDGKQRVISARRANRRERQLYHAHRQAT